MKTRWLLTATLSLLLTGCLKELTEVEVNPNGSGFITVLFLVSPQTVEMMTAATKSLPGANGATSSPGAAKPDPFFNEVELKKATEKFGEGVSYLRAKKVVQNGWQGSMAVYGFKDINKIRVPLQKATGGGMGEPGKSRRAATFLTFALDGGDIKTLRINVPQEEKKDGQAAKKEPEDPQAPAMSESQTASMLEMLKGLEVKLGVRVKGQVVESTASKMEGGNRAVLLHIDMDKIRTSPKFMPIFQNSRPGDSMPVNELLGMPGFQFETNDVVEVRFK